MVAFCLMLGIIVVLVGIANRIGVAWPIMLVLGGMLIGYIPGFPTITLQPDLVLLVFLPPLLYYESFTAPTSEFRANAWWIFQLAFGLVIVTMIAVAAVVHTLVPTLGWGAALVLGAIVSSTDEVAFAPIAERLRVPRHVIATIEGESLVNDATSLILYGVGVAAVVGGTFSLPHAVGQLMYAIVVAIVFGIVTGSLAVLAWTYIKDDSLQAVISIMTPFVAYLPVYALNASAVLAVVTTGLFVNRFTPRVLTPSARTRALGFWQTIVFVLNAFIFLLVGTQYHNIVGSLGAFHAVHLLALALTVSLTVIGVRAIWVFAQGLLPITNKPEHPSGKPDWAHVAVLAWSGMRGGISLAAALAIPLVTASGPFPHRNLIIFLTFCVLLATLVGQGATLPSLINLLHIHGDRTDEHEERLALSVTARAALRHLDELARKQEIPKPILAGLRQKFKSRWEEFAPDEGSIKDHRETPAHRSAETYRKLECELLDTQREELIRLRDEGKIDNTVMRRIQRLLDLETERVQLLGTAGHTDADVDEHLASDNDKAETFPRKKL